MLKLLIHCSDPTVIISSLFRTPPNACQLNFFSQLHFAIKNCHVFMTNTRRITSNPNSYQANKGQTSNTTQQRYCIVAAKLPVFISVPPNEFPINLHKLPWKQTRLVIRAAANPWRRLNTTCFSWLFVCSSSSSRLWCSSVCGERGEVWSCSTNSNFLNQPFVGF